MERFVPVRYRQFAGVATATGVRVVAGKRHGIAGDVKIKCRGRGVSLAKVPLVVGIRPAVGRPTRLPGPIFRIRKSGGGARAKKCFLGHTGSQHDVRRRMRHIPSPAGTLSHLKNREFITVVNHVDIQGNLHLMNIIQALHSQGLFFRGRERRQEHCREDGDDGDDDEEFDQRECFPVRV